MFDPKVNPLWVQFRPAYFFFHQSVWSVKIDCVNSKVILTKTSDENKTVSQSVFSVSEKRMAELFSFLRIDTIDTFEKIPEEEKERLELGYRDGWRLGYAIAFSQQPIKYGKLGLYIHEDPVEMAVDWLEKYFPKVRSGLYPLASSDYDE